MIAFGTLILRWLRHELGGQWLPTHCSECFVIGMVLGVLGTLYYSTPILSLFLHWGD